MKPIVNRTVEIAGFLNQNGWDAATHEDFAADFSPRRYARLTKDGGIRAILMDADDDQKTPEFVMIARLLCRCGIHAPEIYAASPIHGLVLMEDMGSRTFGQLIDSGVDPLPLYRRAVDVLVHLHKNFQPDMASDIGLPVFDAQRFASQVELYLDAYFPQAKGRDATGDERAAFREAWLKVLTPLDALPQSLLLRDFMPDNLMDVPEQEGLAATGVLDFQDAGIGPVAYDIASLCECVRRDVSPSLMGDMIDYYIAQAKPALSRDGLIRACIVLSAQRHMRILGILTQLVLKGRGEKKALLPRVQLFLNFLSVDPVLMPVAEWLK